MDPAPVSKLARILASLLLITSAAGCASEFDQRYEEAEVLRQQAAAQDSEWISTASLLEEAMEQAAQGNEEAALELVEKARFQSEAALRQAEHEAKAWQNRVLK